MGFGTGAAIGAQFANPDTRVVHFAGDGSFRMNCNELATISHYGLPIIIIIFNNGALGNVRQWQTLFFDVTIDKDEMVLPMIPPGKSVDRIMMEIDL